ncbi:MAG: FecR family protein [Mangrovibacterium sp.]
MKKDNHINDLIGRVVSGNATSDDLSGFNALKAEAKDVSDNFKRSRKIWHGAQAWIPAETLEKDKGVVQSTLQKKLYLQIRKTRHSLTLYKLVAVIAFPLALAVSFLFMNRQMNGKQESACSEIAAPRGHVAKCKLPDGTEVWINSGSKLTYQASGFSGSKREVVLDGEAYFEVEQNRQAPFFVRTSYADVKVTGTSFNVKAFSDSRSFETTLSEGSVELKLKTDNPRPIRLNPGERILFNPDRKDIRVQEVDVEIYSSWRNGEIIFKDATLSDLMKELERVYGIRVLYSSPGIADYRFRGMFSYNNNLIDALEKIKITAHLDYYIENKAVWLRKISD